MHDRQANNILHYCFVIVSCVYRRVVEGSVVGSGGCGVHADMHSCSYYTEHGRYGLSCMQKLWSA